MSIEFIRKRAYEKGYLRHRDRKPDKIYKKQNQSIRAIANTEGFQEIINYWTLAKDLHAGEMKALDPIKSPMHASIVLERYKIADDFLTFLENLVEASR